MDVDAATTVQVTFDGRDLSSTIAADLRDRLAECDKRINERVTALVDEYAARAANRVKQQLSRDFPADLKHGHVSPAPALARCGGPGLCATCRYEQAWLSAHSEDQREIARLRWILESMEPDLIRQSRLWKLVREGLDGR